MKTFEGVLNDKERKQYPLISQPDATYPDGYTVTHIFSKKLDASFPEEDSVSLCYEIDYSGVLLTKGTTGDPIVTAQRALKSTFKTTEDLREFAEKYAMPDNPYQIHFNDIGKQVETPEQREKEIVRGFESWSRERQIAFIQQKQAELEKELADAE